jgi:hypothetical protein
MLLSFNRIEMASFEEVPTIKFLSFLVRLFDESSKL